MHMKPLIWNDLNNDDMIMKEGMMFTIEPIFMLNKHKEVFMWPD